MCVSFVIFLGHFLYESFNMQASTLFTQIKIYVDFLNFEIRKHLLYEFGLIETENGNCFVMGVYLF